MATGTLIALVVVTLLAVNVWNLYGPSKGLKAGELAPTLDLPHIGSGEIVGLEEFRGQVVLIDFWATWCPPCREQMPALQNMANDPELGAAIVSVNTDDPDEGREPLVAGFMNQFGLTLTTLLDDGQARARYKVGAIPTLVVVDPEGAVHRVSAGLHSEDDLRRMVAEAAGR
ncbi:hypothetical protein DL240_01440 [Lujinxingia litoralis]|uniref:Thioredoxin domain-containing protein n=2 Tax=Lujinxingia litoralis TaxID=2211119 RepID=A0A328CDA3_9DELT|nr:hypothetical protein DL240_01440 [Lujinxingia litoralis]